MKRKSWVKYEFETGNTSTVPEPDEAEEGEPVEI